MRDVLLIFAIALGAALGIGLAGAVLLRALRRSSITVHLNVLLTTTVVAVAVGVMAVAEAMFLSAHDLEVVLITVAAAAVVSLAVGGHFGRRLARAAVWRDQARERERQLEKGRRDLVAWVSHDLRTPLAGLRAMAEALEDRVVRRSGHGRRVPPPHPAGDRPDDPTRRRPVRAVPDQRGSVAVVVDGGAARRGGLGRAGQHHPVGRRTPDQAGRQRVGVADGRRERTGAGPGRGQPAAQRGPLHPEDGTVRIEAGREDDHAWLSVADTCGGIPPADLPRLFDIAFRGEPARTPGPGDGGASGGLGLAIVHGLVEAHGGRVEVRNTPDGCQFMVRLATA